MAHCAIAGIPPPAIAPVRVVGGGEAATLTAAIIMGRTADGLAREGPPPQKPPSKTQFDFHTRHLLHTLSQHLPNADPATTEYSTLSEEDARLVRRTVGRAQRALERRQERKKKSKSTGTAADALDFYRHATVRARKMKGLDPDEEEDLEEHELLMSDSDSDDEEEEGSSDDDDADDDGDEMEEEEEESSSEEEEISDEEDDKDDDKKADAKDGSDGSGEDDESAASFTSDEFLSAHNDLCEVCSGVGDDDAPLLCCATCTLVFHQDCHRPVLVKEPPDTWSCAYCDDSGVTLHKRDSRERKRASKGVRDMKKMVEDQAELERTEAVAARAAEAAAAGGGATSPSKSRGGTGSSTRTPPKPAHNIRDPDTGRFMTTEKRIALYGSATGMPPGEGEEVEGEGEGGTKQNDLSDLTAEEIARLASSGGDDNGDEKPPAAVSSGAESKPRADTKQDAASGATTPTGPGGSPQNKQQLKGAELKLLLGAMSPEEVDISGPRARREQRKAPSLYDPGDMGGDMDWSSKKEAETRSGRRAAAPPGSKKRKRELLSDVLGKNKKGKSSGGGEKNPKRRRKEEKKKAKRAAKRKKKKVSVQIIVALCYVSAFCPKYRLSNSLRSSFSCMCTLFFCNRKRRSPNPRQRKRVRAICHLTRRRVRTASCAMTMSALTSVFSAPVVSASPRMTPRKLFCVTAVIRSITFTASTLLFRRCPRTMMSGTVLPVPMSSCARPLPLSGGRRPRPRPHRPRVPLKRAYLSLRASNSRHPRGLDERRDGNLPLWRTTLCSQVAAAER